VSRIRAYRDSDFDTTYEIINAGAEAYRGVIPADRWHEPYMSKEQLESEMRAGVAFSCYEDDGVVVGVMGIQQVKDVTLIRHAYVRPSRHRGGIGSALLAHLVAGTSRPILIGTWAEATWAIAFYQRHGFTLVPREQTPALLRKYWSIPDRQIETSVVLTNRGVQ
jgi:N-acetylglutamate synthase-like GNAT family acetyltransferase